jgi:hypothetical protein
LKAKEEEYHRLNAEIEEKTAILVREAEEVLRGRSKLFGGDSPREGAGNQTNRENIHESSSSQQLQGKLPPRPHTSVHKFLFIALFVLLCLVKVFCLFLT